MRVLRHRPMLKSVFNALIGKDITVKLYALNEHLAGLSAAKVSSATEPYRGVVRSASFDAVNTEVAGKVRSSIWKSQKKMSSARGELFKIFSFTANQNHMFLDFFQTFGLKIYPSKVHQEFPPYVTRTSTGLQLWPITLWRNLHSWLQLLMILVKTRITFSNWKTPIIVELLDLAVLNFCLFRQNWKENLPLKYCKTWSDVYEDIVGKCTDTNVALKYRTRAFIVSFDQVIPWLCFIILKLVSSSLFVDLIVSFERLNWVYLEEVLSKCNVFQQNCVQ